jgi:predicted histidine transporter YuiF (NhaC family)
MGDTDTSTVVSDKFTRKHLGAAIGAVSAFAIQLLTGSLPLGALVGLAIMTAFGAIPFKNLDTTMSGGIQLMGFIAFVMLVASGFGNVIRETGGVDAIVEASATLVGGSKLLAAVMMLFIGLLITMGIGSSFGTIPIIAAIYVPLCLRLGFSIPATAILVGVAGALGDAGSPASDSTLGPTAGLNADGQHNHIWDTCVPTFVHYNIPLLIFGTIGALII